MPKRDPFGNFVLTNEELRRAEAARRDPARANRQAPSPAATPEEIAVESVRIAAKAYSDRSKNSL